MKMDKANIILLLCGLNCILCLGQLVVNVKNQGDEIYRENIHANTSLDIITLDFQKTDGTFVTQFIDFKNEIQVFHIVILGEQELGQPQMQAMCFLLRFSKNDFISADAMSKLRQKNPSAVRHAEEDKGNEDIEMDLLVSYDHSYLFSPHIQTFCHNARDAIYIRDKDLKLLARSLNREYTTLLGAAKSQLVQQEFPCKNTTDTWRPCACVYTNCIQWYPCGLKYCKGKDSAGKTVNYRCGIKTCSKCRLFQYQARRRDLCMWELPELGKVGNPKVSVSDVNIVGGAWDRKFQEAGVQGGDHGGVEGVIGAGVDNEEEGEPNPPLVEPL